MGRLTRRRLLAASVPAVGGAAALHAAVPHAHPWTDAQAATPHGQATTAGSDAGTRASVTGAR